MKHIWLYSTTYTVFMNLFINSIFITDTFSIKNAGHIKGPDDIQCKKKEKSMTLV